MQLSLFQDEYVKLSDLYNYVHTMGMWQTENCYTTDIVKIKDTIIISNHCTYGDKENRERAMDTVLLVENGKGYAKIGFLRIGGTIDLDLLTKYPFITKIDYYQDYVVEIDMKVSKCKEIEEESEED